MQIFYGVPNYYINVTKLALEKCLKEQTIFIPETDQERAALFGDPKPFFVKHIIIETYGGYKLYNREKIEIHVPDHILYADKVYQRGGNIDEYLDGLHNKLTFLGGSMIEEYPEQKMAARFIPADAKVLELGSNYGRNTLIISSVLNSSSQLVTCETSSEYAKILNENRKINNMNFKIVNAALSKIHLYQKGWECFPEKKDESFTEVAIIDYLTLVKENFVFDTLVADCEGALKYILRDFPEMLNDIKLIIMENDYNDILDKQFVDKCLRENNFKCVYSEGGGWGPCKDYFFETWHKFC